MFTILVWNYTNGPSGGMPPGLGGIIAMALRGGPKPE